VARTIAYLRQEIDRYIRGQSVRPGFGPLVMQDVADSATACEARIERMGYRWDRVRLLWRAPTRQNSKCSKGR
jgi:hypothetical protein